MSELGARVTKSGGAKASIFSETKPAAMHLKNMFLMVLLGLSMGLVLPAELGTADSLVVGLLMKMPPLH